MGILVFGINHKSASVDLRGQIAFAPEIVVESLQSAVGAIGATEMALLSTCNRTEIYLSGEVSDNQVLSWLADTKRLNIADLQSCYYCHRDQHAIRHMICVASGLDSLVLGEPQIFGQIKSAYAVGREAQTVAAELNQAFQQAFAAAKRVRSETAIGQNPVSVAYASVSLAEQIFANLNNAHALLVGAGETIELVARHHCGEIIVGESTIYSSALDSFDVSDHKCLIQSADLLSNWSKVKSLFLNENYSSTNILSIILNLDPLLIDSYYESYGEALVEDIENASRFLTISLIEDSKLNSVILPLFHPVVLYDLFKYFQEYGVNEKISLNAYCSEVSLRTLLIDTNQLYLLENTGFSQPIFVSDSNNLERIIEYFGLDDTSSVFMSHRPLDDDQIVKSFVAMFEYVGYSKVFNVRLQIDHDQELRGVVRLFKSESVLSSYLTKAKLVLFVDSALFDDLDGYYTEGLKNIHICRVNNEATYDLLIDARRKEKIKYSFRASDSFNIPTYVLAGMNVFSYEEVNGQSYCVLYAAKHG